jgi:hypothetical protein
MNLIPFDTTGKNLPSYLKSFNVAEVNADLTAHAGGGFPVISIKGKVFAIVRDGERVVLPNPKDPESPATAIDVVMVKANKNVSKVFYLKGYDKDNSEGQKPDCYSADGVAPAADAEKPQAKKCATCPHNQWGSKVSDRGATKGKACSDTVRMAVAAVGRINDPMLLRVPPASIRALGEYGQMLAKRGVAYNMVVTKVAFDMEAESPKLTFKPVGFLDDDSFTEVRETAESDIVANILGAVNVAAALPAPAEDPEVEEALKGTPPKAKTVTKAEVKQAVEAVEIEEPVEAPKPKAAKKTAPVSAFDADVELDLDGINFDD